MAINGSMFPTTAVMRLSLTQKRIAVRYLTRRATWCMPTMFVTLAIGIPNGRGVAAESRRTPPCDNLAEKGLLILLSDVVVMHIRWSSRSGDCPVLKLCGCH